MKNLLRLALAASAAVTALAFTGSAWAVYQPRLIVTSATNGANKPTVVILEHLQTPDDDPTLKDTIYAPPGYQAKLTQPAGTTMGQVQATVILRQGGNATATVTGQVVADSPTNWVPQSTACTGTATHEAVWRLNVTIAGTPLQIPIFVDHSAGPEAAFSSVKIQFCLQGPIGTPAGAQLLDAFFDIDDVFTSPANSADRVWRAVMTPYMQGSPNPNPAMTVESQSVVPGRVSLSTKTKKLKRGVVQISGRLLVDGKGVGGVKISFYRVPNLNKPFASAKTKANGQFVLRRKFKKKTLLLAITPTEPILARDLGACPLTALPGVPQGCKTATMAFIAASVVIASPRKKH